MPGMFLIITVGLALVGFLVIAIGDSLGKNSEEFANKIFLTAGAFFVAFLMSLFKINLLAILGIFAWISFFVLISRNISRNPPSI